jgi:hypothetical protein
METNTNFFVSNGEWLIPLILLALQFLMKLLVAEAISTAKVWEKTLEAPVEIGFLSLTFVAAVLLHVPSEAARAYSVSAGYIVLLLISVAIWKLCPKDLTKKHLAIASALTIANFIVTILMLVYSVSLLVPQGASNGG